MTPGNVNLHPNPVSTRQRGMAQGTQAQRAAHLPLQWAGATTHGACSLMMLWLRDPRKPKRPCPYRGPPKSLTLRCYPVQPAHCLVQSVQSHSRPTTRGRFTVSWGVHSFAGSHLTLLGLRQKRRLRQRHTVTGAHCKHANVPPSRAIQAMGVTVPVARQSVQLQFKALVAATPLTPHAHMQLMRPRQVAQTSTWPSTCKR
ncbi:hypothetical protein V8C86DRAFT_2483313 [Haematococcus lacustris]